MARRGWGWGSEAPGWMVGEVNWVLVMLPLERAGHFGPSIGGRYLEEAGLVLRSIYLSGTFLFCIWILSFLVPSCLVLGGVEWSVWGERRRIWTVWCVF